MASSRHVVRSRAGALAESGPPAEIVSLRTFIEDGGARLRRLLFRLVARGTGTLWFPKVHPAEFSEEVRSPASSPRLRSGGPAPQDGGRRFEPCRARQNEQGLASPRARSWSEHGDPRSGDGCIV